MDTETYPEERTKYPKLDRIAEAIAKTCCSAIVHFSSGVESEMSYKRQYILEEVIKMLEERV